MSLQLDKNKEISSNLQKWKAQALSIIDGEEVSDISGQNTADEISVDVRLEINNIVAKIKDELLLGKINTVDKFDKPSSYYFETRINRIKGILNNSSLRLLRYALTNNFYANVNGMSAQIFVKTDFGSHILSVEKIIVGRRTHSRNKTATSLVINEFTLDYRINQYTMRVDSDKRFNEQSLEMMKRLMAPLVLLINNSAISLSPSEQDIAPKTKVLVSDLQKHVYNKNLGGTLANIVNRVISKGEIESV